jgi:hypothetical protein
MNMKSMVNDLRGSSYLGEVETLKQTYYVFQARKYFYLFTFSGAESGNFNCVNPEAVEYVQKKFQGKRGVTSTFVVEQSHKAQYIESNFDALHTLYVLVALRRARIDRRLSRKTQLVFNLRA